MGEKKKEKSSVFSVTKKMLAQVENQRQSAPGKALLANLRTSIGKPLSESLSIWPIMYENMPKELIGKGKEPSAAEKAILNSLQLYALHQQGKSNSVLVQGEGDSWHNIGHSLASLRRHDDSTAIDRRFNTLITSDSYEELIHHLRQMVKLLKAKSEETVDYARLANDLFWFEKGYKETLRLNWARAYYGSMIKGENENE